MMEFQHSWPQEAGWAETEDHAPQVGQSSKQSTCDTHLDKATEPRAKAETQPATRKESDNEFTSQTHGVCPGSGQEVPSPQGGSGSGINLPSQQRGLTWGGKCEQEGNGDLLYKIGKALAGAAPGRAVGTRHRLPLMSCVTSMVNRPVGLMSACIPFTPATSCPLMAPLQAISHSLWHLERSQSSPAGDG